MGIGGEHSTLLIDEFLAGTKPVACDIASGIGGVIHTLSIQHNSQSFSSNHHRPVVKDTNG